jgi:hypothetical protein
MLGVTGVSGVSGVSGVDSPQSRDQTIRLPFASLRAGAIVGGTWHAKTPNLD